MKNQVCCTCCKCDVQVICETDDQKVAVWLVNMTMMDAYKCEKCEGHKPWTWVEMGRSDDDGDVVLM